MWVGGHHVAKDVIGLGVGCTVWHEGWDDDVETVNLESHLKFLQQLDILLFELLGDFLLHEELADLSNTCRRSVSDAREAMIPMTLLLHMASLACQYCKQ